MSCIVYITNKKTNTKYAYRSESFRDPITHQPKSHRTYLGRVDPVTNEIIPKAEKGKRNRNKIQEKPFDAKEQPVSHTKEIDIAELRRQIRNLQVQQEEIKAKIASMDIPISLINSIIHDADI